MPTPQEFAQAVWTMPLGPTGVTPAAPAWVHLIAAREAAHGAAVAAGVPQPVDVDEAALAAALAPQLAGLLFDAAADISDDDLAAIATLVNDVADQRARERLT